jgi:hypothetical protein
MQIQTASQRSKRIEKYRRNQSIHELKRKAKKAFRRQNIWTDEEIDLADAEAREIMKRFRPLPHIT